MNKIYIQMLLTSWSIPSPIQSNLPSPAQTSIPPTTTSTTKPEEPSPVAAQPFVTEQQPRPSTFEQPPHLASEELPSTQPPSSQDEGYGHGVSIDSMIANPRVPTFGEPLANVGTKQATTLNKASVQPEPFAQQTQLEIPTQQTVSD